MTNYNPTGDFPRNQIHVTSGQNVNDLFKYAIGIEQLFEATSTGVNAGNFPPHNIERYDEHRYVLTLALAGWTKFDIDITLHKGYLRVAGAKTEVDADEIHTVQLLAGVQAAPPKQPTMLYQGIAFRDFTREFRLGEDVEVKSAKLEDGLLRIELNRLTPEADKPKTIKIV